MLQSKKMFFTWVESLLVSLSITALITLLLLPSLGTREDLHQSLKVETPKPVAVHQDFVPLTELSVLIRESNNLIGFREKMGYRESRNNYFITNPYGHIGKYQFGKSALKFYGISEKDFLNSPSLQEKLFDRSLSHNKWKLRNEIRDYSGKYVAGVLVTESGILTAAHLVGVNSVKSFFKSKGKSMYADANGTTITNYLKSFQNFDLSQIPASEYDGRKII